ncbi:MAG TPA: ferredoxin reductase family protein [Trebonia sp.]
MSYPVRYPDERYPEPPRRRSPRSQPSPGSDAAPPTRWPDPPRQGLWPGHPSAPFSAVPAAPPASARPGLRPEHPSGPLPRTAGPVPAAGRRIGPTRRTDRTVVPVAVLTLIGLGAAGVLVLWWRSTTDLTSPGELVTGAGDAFGLLAGYGFVVLVALMARLPPLERGIGADRLTRWHAIGGRYVITLVTGHVVLIVWGYSVAAHAKITGETVTLLTAYPDVLMATAAWLLLLAVGAFSARAARRRLSYETWYYAHLYTYLAIALAFSHQFADGPAFATSLAARAAWSALYITVAAAIFWFRVLTPLRNAARYQFTVQGVRREAAGVVSVFITGRDFDRLRAEPGQFFRWRFLTRDLWWQSHPYSLSAMPQPNLMRITVKDRGGHSGSLAALEPGTRIIAEGPYGAFTPALNGRRILLIAGGVGITPIRAMFAALPRRMQADGITLLYRASHPRDVVFSRELDAIAADRGATLQYLVGSREQLGFDPLDAERLQQAVPGLHRCEAYVCGPAGMTETAVKSLAAAGVPRRRIHRESFDF